MKVLKTLSILLMGLMVFIVFCLYDTKNLSITEYEMASPKLPTAFEGFKILHLSDIHGQTFGKNQEQILEKIRTLSPNIIVISGDSLDRNTTLWHNTLFLIEEANKLAPVYISLGNHESIPTIRANALKALKATGARVLENETTLIKMKEESIALSGLDDPKFFWGKYYYEEAMQTLATQGQTSSSQFSMLISHRPEMQEDYAKAGFDLTFSGHAHGGQVRLPFIGGLAAPNQGFFPKLTAGIHFMDGNSLKDIDANTLSDVSAFYNTKALVISRGLGNQYGFPRVLNPPEMILVTLKKNN